MRGGFVFLNTNHPMKKASLIFCLLLVSGFSYGQSNSYRMLRNQFEDSPEVKSYKLSGFLCKIIVKIVEDDDEKLARALKEVRHVRVMTIPKEEFSAQKVTVSGFKSRLPKDNFEVMADIKDGDGSVAVFHRQEKKNKNRYFVIIEDSNEVLAIEMKGYIDPTILSEDSVTSL